MSGSKQFSSNLSWCSYVVNADGQTDDELTAG